MIGVKYRSFEIQFYVVTFNARWKNVCPDMKTDTNMTLIFSLVVIRREQSIVENERKPVVRLL